MAKVRIIKSAEYNTQSSPNIEVNKTLKPVDRSISNLEAEKNETVVTSDHTGLPAHFTVGGKPHSRGGTPLNLPEESFVFSKDKQLKIKDPTILKLFNMGGKSSYTPADIAKQYDINEFRKVLADPNTDKLQKENAELMIANYNEKLGKLGIIQESMKGFPQGIPKIAMPYLAASGFDPASIFAPTGDQMPSDMNQARYGGPIPEMYPARMQMGGGMDNTYVNPAPVPFQDFSDMEFQKKAQDVYNTAVNSYNKSYLPSAYTLDDVKAYLKGNITAKNEGVGNYVKQMGGSNNGVMNQDVMNYFFQQGGSSNGSNYISELDKLIAQKKQQELDKAAQKARNEQWALGRKDYEKTLKKAKDLQSDIKKDTDILEVGLGIKKSNVYINRTASELEALKNKVVDKYKVLDDLHQKLDVTKQADISKMVLPQYALPGNPFVGGNYAPKMVPNNTSEDLKKSVGTGKNTVETVYTDEEF